MGIMAVCERMNIVVVIFGALWPHVLFSSFVVGVHILFSSFVVGGQLVPCRSVTIRLYVKVLE